MFSHLVWPRGIVSRDKERKEREIGVSILAPSLHSCHHLVRLVSEKPLLLPDTFLQKTNILASSLTCWTNRMWQKWYEIFEAKLQEIYLQGGWYRELKFGKQQEYWRNEKNPWGPSLKHWVPRNFLGKNYNCPGSLAKLPTTVSLHEEGVPEKAMLVKWPAFCPPHVMPVLLLLTFNPETERYFPAAVLNFDWWHLTRRSLVLLFY